MSQEVIKSVPVKEVEGVVLVEKPEYIKHCYESIKHMMSQDSEINMIGFTGIKKTALGEELADYERGSAFFYGIPTLVGDKLKIEVIDQSNLEYSIDNMSHKDVFVEKNSGRMPDSLSIKQTFYITADGKMTGDVPDTMHLLMHKGFPVTGCSFLNLRKLLRK